jgi:hypothetical protein
MSSSELVISDLAFIYYNYYKVVEWHLSFIHSMFVIQSVD